jgi:hypothetical protein
MIANGRRRFPLYPRWQRLETRLAAAAKWGLPDSDPLANAKPSPDCALAAANSLILQIEALVEPLGKRMYRGLLKRIARVWNPRDIHDARLQQQVLTHLQAAERGFRRFDAALDSAGPEALTQILRSLRVQSVDRV